MRSMKTYIGGLMVAMSLAVGCSKPAAAPQAMDEHSHDHDHKDGDHKHDEKTEKK